MADDTKQKSEAKSVKSKKDADIEHLSPDPVKTDVRVDDSSRVNMLNTQNYDDPSSNFSVKKKSNIIKILAIMASVTLFIMGLLLDGYAFFNMTYEGLL